MATAKREFVAKNFLDQRHPRKSGARKPNHFLRGHRHLVTLSEEELSRREQGWNDRFTVDPPPKSNKVQSPAHSPTFSSPSTPQTKESKIRNERAQYGKRGGKRNREPKKPSSGKLVPLGMLSKPPSEAAQPTKEEKLRFKVLKAIDVRETFLYQLSALILCTPVQESLFLPSRPTEPPTSTNAGRQQMRSRGGMTLAPTPVSRHGGNSGTMTNAREATKLAQQLATDLQVTGIQCVEALVEWMLESGAQAETPPPFLWRGRNYFLKMFCDLDFAETELQARGVSLDCFRQHNPLLIKPNQKLGRVLAAHSIIMEMVEFANEMTPMELLALSGRMRDSSSREEVELNAGEIKSHTSSSVPSAMNENNDPAVYTDKLRRGEESTVDKQALERHDHESAADLVNILDESLDFIRRTPSREGVTNQTETIEYADDNESNKNCAREEQADRNLPGDTPEKLEPKEGTRPYSDAPELETDVPSDNQSDHKDTSINGSDDDDNQGTIEATAPQSLSALPQAQSDNVVDPAQPNNSTRADEVLPDTELETLGITTDADPNAVQQSSRPNTSENLSKYDNSFDADAGGDDENGKGESIADVQQAGETSTPCGDENADPCEPVKPEDAAYDEARKILNPWPTASPENPITSRTEDSNVSEYENSFDDDTDDGVINNGQDVNNAVPTSATAVATDVTTIIDNVPPILSTEVGQRLAGAEDDQPVTETNDSQTVSKRLESELKQRTFLADENRPTEVNAQGCLAWCSTRALTKALHEHSSINGCMEGSIISMLEQYGLALPESPLEGLLCSDIAKELDLASHLLDECQAVVSDSCSVIAEAIQCSLGLQNSLVSEIEIGEVLEITEAVRQEYHDSTFEYLRIATTLLIFLLSSHNETLAPMKGRTIVSVGFSRLVKVFYPYLVNQSREELNDNWSPVSSVLAAMGLPVDRLYFILDPMCKTLLLAMKLCSRSNQDSQDKDDLAVFPKVNVVCDRNDVLQSSMEYVWRHHLSLGKDIPNFSLFPFFKSSFGEKLVDGVKVEEGEGKGPLKEWFTLIGMQLASKWKQIPTNNILSVAHSTQVTVSGNAIRIPGAAKAIYPGFQLEWETSDGDTIHRVVNKSVEDDTFLLDRSVPVSHSFSASQLHIAQPTTAILEYVQGSESYWLNENMYDSPETRNMLVFVGWLLASAMLHFSSIQLRIHPLFFRLLLNPQHCVTLEEVQLFDPQLFESLSRMKDMKPSDFAEYLKFEGADASLTVEAYITSVLQEKFGSTAAIAWQLHSVRQGFTRIITVAQLDHVGIAEADLVESICGSNIGYGEDFVVNEIFRVAADTEFTSCLPLMNAFWQIVNSFDPQLKRKFIKFVTGVDTLPLPGTEFLRIEMPFTAISPDEYEKCLQMLPQAHTCDNTLELPHYWKALCWREQHDEHDASTKLEDDLILLLGKKLRDAVEYSSGYGLDKTSAVAGVLAEKPLDYDTKEESYDSMGIPALVEDQNAAENSPQTSNHEVDGGGTDSVQLETKTESPAAVVSPRPEESYEEYDDWEEESVS